MMRFVERDGAVIGMVIEFRKSKCNQMKKKQHADIPCVCGFANCAVHEVLRLLEMRDDLQPDSPLLVFENCRKLQARDVAKHMKLLSTKSGLDPSNYTPHSLRSGGACDYIRWGIDIYTVKEMGRWKRIDSMEPYTKDRPENVVAMTFGILRGFAGRVPMDWTPFPAE